jgi:tRNA threonylcarbamoyl adenosine modification protein YeaZ
VDEPILALDGALGPFTAAIAWDGRCLSRSLEGRSALEQGLGLVEELLKEAGLELRALGGIAVGTGPGGFTGLRIALSFAKSLALGARLPLVGISSFDTIEEGAAATNATPRLTVVTGRPGVACIRLTGEHDSLVACGRIVPTVERLLPMKLDRVTLVGATEDVRSAVGERATKVHLLSAGLELPAVILTRIARGRAAATSAHAVAPDYGELPAASVKARKAQREG